MVMASPSPQQVGREFVRQYYTVLHEAPEVLHRFYSSGSTFVHGGVDRPGLTIEEPVIGQLEIDKKIKLLNFKDCHTKIRQVDSQSTIGNGVVVQVTGELSNNGEPMRRFMQTFVLAPQTPKKFYVHNDIFRYQDEVYQDNSDSESEEHQPIETPAIVSSSSTQLTSVGVGGGNNNVSSSSVSSTSTTSGPSTGSNQQQKPSMNNYQYAEHEHENVVVTQQQQQPGLSSSSSSSSSTDLDNKLQDLNVNEQSNSMVNGHVQQQQQTPIVVGQLEGNEEVKTVEVAVKDVKSREFAETNEVGKKDEIRSEAVPSSDTKNSWAKIITNQSLASSQAQNQQQFQNNASAKYGSKDATVSSHNGPSSQTTQKPLHNGTSNVTSASTKNQNNKSRNVQQQSAGSNSTNVTASSASLASTNANQQAPQPQRERDRDRNTRIENMNTTNNVNTNNINNVNTTSSFEEDAEKRFGRYPDGQQVFVGNLSQDLSEAELKQFFGTYGKVVEVRINTNTKQQSGRRLPNYGFVVFEDKQTVDTLLGATKSNNLTYKNDKGMELRLNVEEKRARQGGREDRGGDRGRDSGFRGGKSNRATRSSSNGSRGGGGGGGQQNQSNGGGTHKKNFNTHTNDSNYIENGNIKRKEGSMGNQSNVNYDNSSAVDGGNNRDGGAGYRKTNSNYRRS